ncbi:hypothetical protein GJAV_G00259830 [Gymnothorax javanicus]|nr:hypothetical protein GJAV_G00259830 [Gymnothorax javanicus]
MRGAMGPAAALLLSALVGLGSAQREVSVQGGPLVRTEGSHITIWCNVTGYKGGVEQNFEWSAYLSSAPDRELRMVSTSQQNFAYSIYAQRVSRGEIWVERLSADSALLHITKLEAKDQGQVECYTPNTDGEFLGTYSAKTQLIVIADSLSVHAPPQALERVEGDSVQLSCEVTRHTAQHTHLSVGWYLRVADASAPPQDLVTLSRDFQLEPGPSYRQRFAAGELRLDKLSSASYKLSMSKLRPADSGTIYCEATEWIQDPDGSWFPMTQKQSDATSLRVQPTDRDFSLQLVSERRWYLAGEALDLRCSIDAQNVAERFFSLSWISSSGPVAVVGPSAVPVLTGDYVAREATGQLTIRKESPSVYLLRLQRLRAEDSGKYICRVTERERTPSGEFVDRNKRSRNVQISVQPIKSNISVQLLSNGSEVLEGDPIALSCVVGGVSDGVGGTVTVSWSWSPGRGGAAMQDLASLAQDGTVRTGPLYRERRSYGEVAVERLQGHTFVLVLRHALPGDEGQYHCTASEWRQSPDFSWEKIGEKSVSKALTVKAVESSFSIAASSRTPSVPYGDSFDLQCVVRLRSHPLTPISVTWRFQPPGGGAELPDLVTLLRDGTLRWGESPGGGAIRASVERSAFNNNFRLRVNRAGPREGGTYQCSAQLWRRKYDGNWSEVANRTSNLLGISVLKPVSKLRVQKTNQSAVCPEGGRVRVNCSILGRTSADSQHTVLWYAGKGAEPELLLRISHMLGFEYGAYAEEERLKRRLQAERLSPTLYGLTVHHAEVSDSGTYYCHVEEWLLDPEGQWYRLAHDTSGFTQVSVTQPEARLRVEESVSNVSVSESGSVRLGCRIRTQSSRDSSFSVAWYRLPEGGPSEGVEPHCMFSIGHDAVFGNGNCSPDEPLGPDSRVLFERMTSDLYSLTIQRARPEDSGRYYCHVQEWLLNPRNTWYRLSTSESGLTVVTVTQTVSSLQSLVCSSESLFFFVFLYPFPVIGGLLFALLLIRYKARNTGRSQDGKNGAPLLWIKEPHMNYSPTCLDPPTLNLHPGTVD